jgi:hypothetical protein
MLKYDCRKVISFFRFPIREEDVWSFTCDLECRRCKFLETEDFLSKFGNRRKVFFTGNSSIYIMEATVLETFSGFLLKFVA